MDYYKFQKLDLRTYVVCLWFMQNQNKLPSKVEGIFGVSAQRLRKIRGQLVRTGLVKRLHGSYARRGTKLSASWCKNLSKSHTGLKRTRATKLLMSKIAKQKGWKPPGRIWDKAAREHLGSQTKERWKNGKYDHITPSDKFRGGYRKDLGYYFRSSWEANYARYLNYRGIVWEYEPKRFYLKELDCTYLPDFRLEDGTYIEVKGWDTREARIKRKAFRKQYGYKLIVIGRFRYNKLISRKEVPYE